MRALELLIVATLVALSAWVAGGRAHKPVLTWSLSPNLDGADSYAVSLDGNRLSGPSGIRTLPDEEVEQIHRALDGAGAWDCDAVKSESRPSLHTDCWIRRGHQSVECHWDGLASIGQMRLVDALLCSPLGPEFHQCIRMAGEPLERRETQRRNDLASRQDALLCRQEVLLEGVEAQRLLPLLEYAYPQVNLETHPTVNGLFASGPHDVILQLKNHIRRLERVPWTPKNSDGRFRGRAELSDALQESRSNRFGRPRGRLSR